MATVIRAGPGAPAGGTRVIHIETNVRLIEGYVFVVGKQTDTYETLPLTEFQVDTWEAIPSFDLRNGERKVIKCGICERPAQRIDAYWPWMNTFTRCAYHLENPPEGWVKWGRKWHYVVDGRFTSLCYGWELESFGRVADIVPPIEERCKRCERERAAKERFQRAKLQKEARAAKGGNDGSSS